MKTTKISKYMIAALMAGAPLLWSSCSDTWNEHYDASAGQGEGSLLTHIAQDPSLANFYRVITTIGGAETLDSPQQFTVWAPRNLTSAQADSIIAVYNADKAKGVKTTDNKAISQFMQNHVALYSRPISSYTNDTIKMLSNKYMTLKGTSTTTGTLNSTPFNGMELCNNGILYKTNDVMTFFPNVRECVEQRTDMTSVKDFIASFDEYTLDASSSVAGEIVDGKQQYLDSVTTLSNKFLNTYSCFINREDSTYTFIAPTDDVYKKLYDKYIAYYKYDNGVNKSDSLADYYANIDILEGRFFNTSTSWMYNLHPTDSLCNTSYRHSQTHYPRQNVYYEPNSTILKGLQKVECSNGYVYVDDKVAEDGAIAPQTTFFGRQDIECYSPRYYEVPTDNNNEETMDVDTKSLTYYWYEDEDSTEEMSKTYYYSEIGAKKTMVQSEMVFKIPNTLSGCYYNIYLVTVPNQKNPLPSWMNIQYVQHNEKGEFPTSYGTSSYFNNPNPITEDTEGDDIATLLKQSHSERIFRSAPNVVDTILVQSAVQFDYSGYGLTDGVVNIRVTSVGPSSSASREKIYTRTLRLCEFILVPYETKEEAEEAKDDLNAFNDEILSANSKY